MFKRTRDRRAKRLTRALSADLANDPILGGLDTYLKFHDR